jgi:hypothetical protein
VRLSIKKFLKDYTLKDCLCGHTDTEHTKERRINRGAMPKGMKLPESKEDISHNACSLCDCDAFKDRDALMRKHQEYFRQQQMRQIQYQQNQQQRPQQQQQQKMRRSDGSWFYLSSNTYILPAEDTGSSNDSDTSNNGNNDTTTDVDTVDGDYEF